MDITERSCDNGGEIDCGAWHKDGRRNYRLTIRRIGASGGHGGYFIYEAYRHYFDNEEEKTEKQGTLEEVVRYVNQTYRYKDTVNGRIP